MDREDILKMAREAGMIVPSGKYFAEHQESAIRFATLVAAKAAQDEREACALICDQESAEWEDHSDIKAAWVSSSLDDAADKIRARGE